MKIIKYPDGSSYVESNVELMGKMQHNVTFKINSYEDLWHLNQYVDAFYNFNQQKPIITIPNLIDAQADRRFNVAESSGLKLVCEFLNNMNADFKIFHPHHPEVVEALIDNVEIIDNSKFISQVITKLNILWAGLGMNPNAPITLMSSDAGGFKPLMKLCDKIGWKGETISVSKAKTEAGMKQILPEFTGGKDILIIDDICVYGGTFKGLSKLIRETGFEGKLYLAVSHMTVQNLGEDPVTNYFDKVFTTNSKFNEYWYLENIDDHIEPENLEIIKLF